LLHPKVYVTYHAGLAFSATFQSANPVVLEQADCFATALRASLGSKTDAAVTLASTPST
jgi:hypothetical protein